MRTVTGHYSRHGYTIRLNDVDVYSAGNHKLDSQARALDPRDALPLDVLRQHCEHTTEGIAEERNAEFGGVFEVEPDEYEDA